MRHNAGKLLTSSKINKSACSHMVHRLPVIITEPYNGSSKLPLDVTTCNESFRTGSWLQRSQTYRDYNAYHN